MFPIPWNFPFRKKNGTLVNMEDIAGTSLPEYSASDAGKVLGVDEDGNLAWVTSLPEYSASDAGKVLGVDEEGNLAWVTVSGGSNFSRGSVKPDALSPIIEVNKEV